MSRRIVVLGAGPAGLWTAMSILKDHPDAAVTVLEKTSLPGGIASSFSRDGLVWDMGSHRFHPSASPEVFSSVRDLLGDDLLKRPRNGRIRLEGRFLKYPLKPADMFLHLPLSFTAGVALDALTSPFRGPASPDASFDKTLRSGLGPTICRRFYFPYAEKLWGLSADELDGEQARRRVSAAKLSGMIKKVLRFSLPGNKGSFFHYPRGGFGTIFEKAVERIDQLGGRTVFNAKTVGVITPSQGAPGMVKALIDGVETDFPAEFIFSTLPLTDLTGMMHPKPSPAVISAAGALRYRSMVLCFIKFDAASFTPYDAHYFPDPGTLFSRISERKNYEDRDETPETTGLCVEIPCWKTDPVWSLPDAKLVETVLEELTSAGFSVPGVASGFSGRIEHAYPSYPSDWRRNHRMIDEWLGGLPGIVSLGRQGVFAHDNTHHAMEMGIRAAGCLDSSLVWDRAEWMKARLAFGKHVVED